MKKVKVYSTPTCVYCQTLKEYLAKNKIEFENIDVFENPKALDEMIEKSGQMTVPVVDIDGRFIVGFDRKIIDELLNIK